MKQYRRDLTVSAPAFVESGDDRIVELAFSSEAPYSRIYTDQNGDPVELKEILVHDKDAVDLDVLNDKASLLFNHEFDNHIGVVVPGSARIDEDGVGRALVKFSQVGQLANETYDKVKEGTMSKVSVGYTVLEGHADFSKGVYFVTKWQPYEISIVSVPADSSVGVGRSLNTNTDELDEEKREVEVENKETEIKPEEEIRSEENQENKEPENEESPSDSGNSSSDSESIPQEVNPEETRSEEQPEENKPVETDELNTNTESERQEEAQPENKPEEEVFQRSAEDTEEIRAIGKHLNISEDEIQRAIEDKEITVESFKQRALNINTESKTFAKGKIKMTDTIKTLENRFDLSAALRSLSQEKALNGAEAEYSQEMARQAAQRGRAQRSNSVFVPTSALSPVVGTDIRHDSFVDLLLEKSVLGSLGVNTLTGLTAPISLPRMNKNATDAFGFVNENGEGALSEVAFDGVPMSMKTFTGAVAMSRQSMLSMPNIGALVAEHLIKASRIKLEKLILGNEEVTNARAGLVKQLIDAGKVVKCGLTHKDFLVEIAKLTDAGVDEAQIALAMRGALAADLASTLRDQAVAGYIMENGKIANRPVHTSGVLAEGAILAGDFSALTIGEWAGLEIDVDTTSLRAKGGTAVRVWADLDWAVSNPDAIRVIQKVEASKAK
ncbi:phage major capsid protein [Salmonella enterica]|nr:phage major capsid protein [Salmonella enterica subsp. enterica]EAB1403095.1 phage major capsid protein [Salmonella enterica]EBH9235560.1 phage major capsid protein [Salmonella enterica subsp. enterica serovar Manhattan]ECU7961803.1 phage major capsid protein [Salmonella enterica subsp. enterica serovar Newport]EAB4861958.1 phage major capsid protein [Salmonella enterica]